MENALSPYCNLYYIIAPILCVNKVTATYLKQYKMFFTQSHKEGNSSRGIVTFKLEIRHISKCRFE